MPFIETFSMWSAYFSRVILPSLEDPIVDLNANISYLIGNSVEKEVTFTESGIVSWKKNRMDIFWKLHFYDKRTKTCHAFKL